VPWLDLEEGVLGEFAERAMFELSDDGEIFDSSIITTMGSRRQARRAAGLCGCNRSPRLGKTTCVLCSARYSTGDYGARHRARNVVYMRAKANRPGAGTVVCVRCPRPCANGRKRCEVCLAGDRARKARAA
jgi:hypothetical protein